MINIEETSLIENETCKFYLPCGMCEFTKKQCTKLIAPERINYIPTWDTTPVKTYKEWKVGDWPPGPHVICDDRVSTDFMNNPDTFRIHPETDPRYNTIDSRSYSNIDVLGNKYTTGSNNGK